MWKLKVYIIINLAANKKTINNHKFDKIDKKQYLSIVI